jgi:hypothetical protein
VPTTKSILNKEKVKKDSDLVINLAREFLILLIAEFQGLVMILGEELVSQQCKRSVG